MAKKETPESINEAVTEALAQGDKISREAMDKGMKLATDAQTFAQANVDAIVASATAATKGMQTLSAQIADLAKANIEHSMSAMKSLTGVKSAQEVFEVQTNLTKDAVERNMADAKKIAEASSALAQEVIKPLSERAKAAFEKTA